MEYIKATEKDLEHIVMLVQETIKTSPTKSVKM